MKTPLQSKPSLGLSPLSLHQDPKKPKPLHPWGVQDSAWGQPSPGVCLSVTSDFQRALPAQVSSSLLPLTHLSHPEQICLHIPSLLRAFRSLWRAHYQRLGINWTKDFPGELQCRDTSAAGPTCSISCFGLSRSN